MRICLVESGMLKVNVFLAFFCDKFACPTCIFFSRNLMFGVDLHFSFACVLHFAFWKRVLETEDSFLYFSFKLEACLGNEGHFYFIVSFANLQFPGRTFGKAGKIQKHYDMCNQMQKCKNTCKTSENDSETRTKTMFLLAFARFPGFGIFLVFL